MASVEQLVRYNAPSFDNLSARFLKRRGTRIAIGTSGL